MGTHTKMGGNTHTHTPHGDTHTHAVTLRCLPQETVLFDHTPENVVASLIAATPPRAGEPVPSSLCCNESQRGSMYHSRCSRLFIHPTARCSFSSKVIKLLEPSKRVITAQLAVVITSNVRSQSFSLVASMDALSLLSTCT